MEEWERRKEEGELGSEQEQEEENIYAVSKDQEVWIIVTLHWRNFKIEQIKVNYQISVQEEKNFLLNSDLWWRKKSNLGRFQTSRYILAELNSRIKFPSIALRVLTGHSFTRD